MTKDMSGTEATTTKACNICRKAASNLCSRCGIRIYCSTACQKADWNEHRHYCRRQPSDEETLDEMKKDIEAAGLNFEEVIQNVDKPKDPKCVEKYLHDTYGSKAAEDGDGEGDGDSSSPWEDRSWPPQPKEWTLNKDTVWMELKELPMAKKCCFSFSFTTAGYMDEDTGDLLYLVHGLNCSSGNIRVMGCSLGKPTRHDLENAIYTALMSPKDGSGPPQRPSDILFAHRWGKEYTDELIDLLKNEIDIEASLETKEASELSAKKNGTDPDGHNWNIGKFVNQPLVTEFD